MGKKNLKSLKRNSRNNESTDFKSFSDKILAEQERVKDNSHYTNRRTDGYTQENNDKKKKPTSKTSSFVDMIDRIVNPILDNPPEGIKMTTRMNFKKERNGVVITRIEFNKNGNPIPEPNSTLLIYYIENRSISFKNASKQDTYQSHIMVAVQQSGAILFSRFGLDTIEKSEKYIKGIIDNSLSFLTQVPEENGVSEVESDVDSAEETEPQE